MLDSEMVERLNSQINLELQSSNLYLQMSCWCAFKSLDGCAAFLAQHAEEERIHMQKLITYLNETGALVELTAIPAPTARYDSLQALFEQVLEHEQHVTDAINKLVHQAHQKPDYATYQFLQWYVAEQHQEEFLFKSVLDKIKLIGTDHQGIFFIDKEIGALATPAAAGIGVADPTAAAAAQ